MSAVSDTSPILGLAAIDCLELLHEQFGAVFIPPAVLAELKTETDFRGTVAIRQALTVGWLEVKKVNNIPLVRALALATDLSVEIIVMDEHDGRARARAMGLKPVGVIGILLRAKKDGKIAAVAEALQSLRREIGFFIADELYQQILTQAGE